MQVLLNTSSIADYRKFLQIKQLPKYSIRGHVATFPDEYASRLGITMQTLKTTEYEPEIKLFDYQEALSRLAIQKKKFALFVDCGFGKTLIYSEYALHVLKNLPKGKLILIISPLMVIDQTLSELKRFYGDDYPIEQVHSNKLQDWLTNGGKQRIGITNYDALKHAVKPGRLACLILDESSMLKSHYGKYGTEIIRLSKGLEWKLAGTGTPAPNDRIEYANHAVLLDQYPTINSFLARFFVNKGQTQERWVIKPHAIEPFYRSLSHFSIFMSNPATYGWKDNTANIPPIHIHQHFVETTPEQADLVYKQTGSLIAHKTGGITSRISLATIAKGWKGKRKVPTNKYTDMQSLVASWPDESTLIWCKYNPEQDFLEEAFPDAISIRGETPYEERLESLKAFKAGQIKQLISKPKILGFGQNLQIVTRQLFSTLQDSYEEYYQAVKRSNRVGSTKPLNVHIPYTDIELPMIDNVLRKAAMVEHDTREQERIFKTCSTY